jgi:hypothetical protein
MSLRKLTRHAGASELPARRPAWCSACRQRTLRVSCQHVACQRCGGRLTFVSPRWRQASAVTSTTGEKVTFGNFFSHRGKAQSTLYRRIVVRPANPSRASKLDASIAERQFDQLLQSASRVASSLRTPGSAFRLLVSPAIALASTQNYGIGVQGAQASLLNPNVAAEGESLAGAQSGNWQSDSLDSPSLGA